jgi:lambda family phage tail tape measure protein
VDVASALSLKVDSSSVVTAANDLDRFSAAATKASTAGAKINVGQSGSIAKLVAEVQSANSKLTAIVGTLEKIASANRATAAANDNTARSFANVDSHVTAYRQHLEGLVTAQRAADTVTVAADAHVVGYTQHLAGLARAQQDANAHVMAYRANLAATAAPAQQADAHVLAYRDSLNTVGNTARTAAASIKFTAQEGLNASRQLADIGVTAAMGMNPFLIAIQQGPQLFDILQSSAIRTGTSIGTVFRAAAASVLAAAAPFLPLIALLALTAAGIAAMSAQANDDSGLKKYTTAMGYTKEEVKKLNAVTVTFGDTTKAVFQVAFESAAEALGINASEMGKTWDRFLDRLVAGTRAALAGVYALFAGTRAYLGALEKGGVTGLVKQAFGYGDPNLVKDTYGKAYQDGQAGLDRIIAQARKNAQGRQTEMAKGFYDKPTTPKGPKPFTYDDLLKDADKIRNDLTKNAAQIGVYGEALARVTYEQDLLNKASERGLKLSPAQRSAIAGIAAELAKMSEANRRATFMEEGSQQVETQLRSLEQQRGAIGLLTGALAAYTYEQDRLNKALADHITLTDADRQKISDDAQRVGAATTTNINEKARDDGYRAHNERMRQLEVERGALGLTGEALISYNYQQEEITRQLQSGVQFADLNIDAIRRQGEAYAAQRYQLDQQKQSIADAREVTKGFFTDWIDGARQGSNVFKSFADSAVNALNKIIDKLLDKTLDGFLNGAFSGGSAGTSTSGGGFLSGLLGSLGIGGKTAGQTAASSTQSTFGSGSANPGGGLSFFARGGAFDQAQRFAKGGAFTNTVVNTPTLFRFAKGTALGEMGEAGPEAIMPLKRGKNGALGVQMHNGGRPAVRMGDIHNTYQVTGAFDRDQVVGLIRQGGAATYDQVKRDLQSLLQQLDTDGSFAT